MRQVTITIEFDGFVPGEVHSNIEAMIRDYLTEQGILSEAEPEQLNLLDRGVQ
ncbi:MAG: hypothetical protein ABJH52_17135 [Henriciella sp.]